MDRHLYRYLKDPSIWVDVESNGFARLTSKFTIMAGGPAPSGPVPSPLGMGWGYGIVLGIGFLFALGMVSEVLF